MGGSLQFVDIGVYLRLAWRRRNYGGREEIIEGFPVDRLTSILEDDILGVRAIAWSS